MDSGIHDDPTLRQRLIDEIPYGEIAPAEANSKCDLFLCIWIGSSATGQTLMLTVHPMFADVTKPRIENDINPSQDISAGESRVLQ